VIDYRVGDSRTITATIPDGTVDLVCCSPPFLALRSYLAADHEMKGKEIGSEQNPSAFIDTLLALTAEWGRVLAPHGSIAIELGDTYSGSGGENHLYEGSNPAGGFNGSAGQSSLPGHKRTVAGWPRAKSLALIPQLYAVALAYGINPLTGQPSPAGRWLVRNVIVWHRPNPAVGALGDKVRPSTSYIVVATRSAKRWFDLTAVRTEHKADPAKYTGNGYTKGCPEGVAGNEAMQGNPAGAPPLDAWFDEYDYHDTWTLTTQPSSLAHYAMWPAKLAERLVLMMCPRWVCRECGQPQRRVEADVAPRQVNGDHAGKDRTQGRSEGGPFVKSHLVIKADRETRGWTNCGCPDHDYPGSHWKHGVVLDPFAGTGTTLAVAALHGRDAIGIDIDERNKAIYPARYDEVKKALYGTPAPMPGQGVLL
jgi:site-specific DNA-methyltransferase (cytosine-N4-specific)